MLTPSQMEVLIDAAQRGIDPDFDYPAYLESLGTLLEEVGSDTTLSRVQELQKQIAERKEMMKRYADDGEEVLADEEAFLLEELEDELHRLYVLGPDVFKPENKERAPKRFLYGARYDAADKVTWPRIKKALEGPRAEEVRPSVYRKEEDGKRTVLTRW